MNPDKNKQESQLRASYPLTLKECRSTHLFNLIRYRFNSNHLEIFPEGDDSSKDFSEEVTFFGFLVMQNERW